MNICVYGASSSTIAKSYINPTEELGEKMAKRGHNLVYGAGALGLMGAAARGVLRGGGKIIGVAPAFFKVDGVLFDECDEMIYTDTMRERKGIMEEKSDAFIMTPGGLGTYDEFFEILTLKQLGRHAKPIAVFNINGYFDPLRAVLENAVNKQFMTPQSLRLCEFFDRPERLLDYLENCSGVLYSISDYKDIKR